MNYKNITVSCKKVIVNCKNIIINGKKLNWNCTRQIYEFLTLDLGFTKSNYEL